MSLFTFEAQNALLNSHAGDFIGFQAAFESRSHGAVHRIVGGCVHFLQRFHVLIGRAGIYWGDALQKPEPIARLAPSGPLMVRLRPVTSIPSFLTIFGRPLVYVASRGKGGLLERAWFPDMPSPSDGRQALARLAKH